MNALIPTLGLALIAALLYSFLHKTSPSFAMLLSLAAGMILLVQLASALQTLLQGITELAGRIDSESFACLLRCAGLLLLTDYTRTLCEEAGAQALAWCTGFAGRALGLAALWPLLEEVCRLIWDLAG